MPKLLRQVGMKMTPNDNDELCKYTDNDINEKCPYLFCPDDKPTKVTGLGWRAIYTLIAWIVLAMGVMDGDGFFVSIMLFATPLVMDYAKFKPNTEFRIKIRRAGYFLAGLWTIFSVLGLVGVFEILKIKDVLTLCISGKFLVLKCNVFPIYIVWMLICLSVIFAFVDWVAYDSKYEIQYLNKHYKKAQPTQQAQHTQ